MGFLRSIILTLGGLVMLAAMFIGGVLIFQALGHKPPTFSR
jgi:hypothetical protein